jgi:hypothetical protein
MLLLTYCTTWYIGIKQSRTTTLFFGYSATMLKDSTDGGTCGIFNMQDSGGREYLLVPVHLPMKVFFKFVICIPGNAIMMLAFLWELCHSRKPA